MMWSIEGTAKECASRPTRQKHGISFSIERILSGGISCDVLPSSQKRSTENHSGSVIDNCISKTTGDVKYIKTDDTDSPCTCPKTSFECNQHNSYSPLMEKGEREKWKHEACYTCNGTVFQTINYFERQKQATHKEKKNLSFDTPITFHAEIEKIDAFQGDILPKNVIERKYKPINTIYYVSPTARRPLNFEKHMSCHEGTRPLQFYSWKLLTMNLQQNLKG